MREALTKNRQVYKREPTHVYITLPAKLTNNKVVTASQNSPSHISCLKYSTYFTINLQDFPLGIWSSRQSDCQ